MTRFADNEGVRIAWEEHGSGPPVVMVHGLGYARWGWGPLAERLAERFRVITFDNRGIGESDVPPGPYTASDMAGDLAAVIAAADAAPTHLVGTSLGGMVAQELAAMHPELVERLVLLSTTPGGSSAYPMPSETVELISTAADLDPEVALRRFVENALSPTAPAELVDRIYSLRLQHPPHPAGWQAQAAAGTGYDSAGRHRRITVPTLVITGSADRVVDHRNSRLLAEELPNARLVVFEGRGHLLFWEDPAGVAEVISDFLQEAE